MARPLPKQPAQPTQPTRRTRRTDARRRTALLLAAMPLVASCTATTTAAPLRQPSSAPAAPAPSIAVPASSPDAAQAPAGRTGATVAVPAEQLAAQQRTRELHERLTWAGVYSGPLSDVESEQTRTAVKRFQRKFGLSGDGRAGARTWATLRKVTADGDGIPARCRTSGKVICVDKTLKLVRALDNGRVVQSLDARFGRESLPTANGSFRVKWRSRDHWSSKYDAPMPFALFFYGGQAVHYSPEFAQVGYSRSGSHGCINLRDKAGARQLFDWAPRGTTVVVYWS